MVHVYFQGRSYNGHIDSPRECLCHKAHAQALCIVSTKMFDFQTRQKRIIADVALPPAV